MVGTVAKAVAVAVLGMAGVVHANGNSTPYPQDLNVAPNTHWFASWQENTNPSPQDFFATPYTTNGNIPFVQNQMTLSANAGKPLGIKIEGPLSDANAAALFNTHFGGQGRAISYIFGDLEGGNGSYDFAAKGGILAGVKQLVNQVRKPGSWSDRAYVGQFGLTPLNGVGFGNKQDPTRRGPLQYTTSDYQNTGVNMANTDLYPGSPNYRNKSTFDWANANIRTGLFVGPIGRMTAVQDSINRDYNGKIKSTNNAAGGSINQFDKQIPWVARFNNWGNSSLDSNGTTADGYRFIPGAPLPQAGLNGSQTSQQMLGRGDFSAQILHYRLRGAYSINLFEPGVVGYSVAQQEDDARSGWYGGSLNPGDPNGANAVSRNAVAHANNIFAQPDSQAATLTLNPVVDGTSNASGIRSENSGTIWSGEYSKNLKQLDILASNLDTINHMIKFGTVDAYDVFTLKNGSGYTYDGASALTPSRNALIEAGMHRMLQFDLVTTRVYSSSTFTGKFSTKTIWLLNQNYLVFGNNAGRGDTGIPEPTTFGMLAAAGSMAAVCRRQRRKDA